MGNGATTNDEVRAHLLIRLGQGAGDKDFSQEAVRVLHSYYGEALKHVVTDWADVREQAKTFAFKLGRRAAASAAESRTISGQDMERAMHICGC